MGSRVGSILVFAALAVIVTVAVVLVLRFSGDSEADQPVMVISLIDDQPVLLGQPLAVDVRARSGEPISIFALLVDGVIATQAIAIDNADQGLYSATLFWTPTVLGFANLRVVATDTAGTQTELAVRVDVTDDAQRVAQAEAARAGQQPQSEGAEPTPPSAESEGDAQEGEGTPTEETRSEEEPEVAGNGTARILSPEDGTRYELGSETPLDVTIETSGTGALSSVLLYVTPVLADGSFGRSQLAHSANPDVTATGGVYRETVPGIERRFPRAGAYDLQLVALTPEQRRFEDFVRVTVVGGTADDEASEDGEESDSEIQEEADADEGALADLAILTVRQDDSGIAVTIINNGDTSAERVAVEISLIRARDASLLASANALLTLDPEQRVSVPVEVTVAEPTNAFVVLGLDSDADQTNNTFEVALAASESIGGDEADDEASDELGEENGAEEPPTDQQDSTQAAPPPSERADLTFLEARFTDDGYALLTVINAGEAAAGEFIIQITTENGELLETISRGEGAAALAAGRSEILAGSAPHSGPVVIILDPNDTTVESDENNNRIRLEVGE